MGYSKIKSYAKINLALNIVGKTSSLHKIESIVAFVSLHDEIFIKKIKSKSHNILFSGKFSNNIGIRRNGGCYEKLCLYIVSVHQINNSKADE